MRIRRLSEQIISEIIIMALLVGCSSGGGVTLTPTPATTTSSTTSGMTTSRSVEVQVVDKAGKPIQGAVVQFDNQVGRTAASGIAQFTAIQDGTHNISAELEEKVLGLKSIVVTGNESFVLTEDQLPAELSDLMTKSSANSPTAEEINALVGKTLPTATNAEPIDTTNDTDTKTVSDRSSGGAYWGLYWMSSVVYIIVYGPHWGWCGPNRFATHMNLDIWKTPKAWQNGIPGKTELANLHISRVPGRWCFFIYDSVTSKQMTRCFDNYRWESVRDNCVEIVKYFLVAVGISVAAVALYSIAAVLAGGVLAMAFASSTQPKMMAQSSLTPQYPTTYVGHLHWLRAA